MKTAETDNATTNLILLLTTKLELNPHDKRVCLPITKPEEAENPTLMFCGRTSFKSTFTKVITVAMDWKGEMSSEIREISVMPKRHRFSENSPSNKCLLAPQTKLICRMPADGRRIEFQWHQPGAADALQDQLQETEQAPWHNMKWQKPSHFNCNSHHPKPPPVNRSKLTHPPGSITIKQETTRRIFTRENSYRAN